MSNKPKKDNNSNNNHSKNNSFFGKIGQAFKEGSVSKIIVLILNYLIPLITPFLCFIIHELTWRISRDGGFKTNPFETIASTEIFLLNLAFFYLVWIILTSLIGKSKISSIILVLLSYILGLTNYFLVMFRSAPLSVADLLSIKTAAAVQGNYEFIINSTIITMGLFSIMLLASNAFFGFKIYKAKEWWKKLLVHITPALIAFFCLVGMASFLDDNKIGDKLPHFDSTLFTPTHMAECDGYFLQMMYQMRFVTVKKPDGYSKDKAKSLLKKYSDSNIWDTASISKNNGETKFTSPNEKVNVIAIMNESFSDIAVNGAFKTDQEYMPYIKELMKNGKNTVSGYMYASVLGGNTANSEFEFLTGNTMAFLPQGSIPYQQYVTEDTDSIAKTYKSDGYTTIGTHPYVSYGWKRSTVYPRLGFDQSLFARDMGPLEKYRVFATDQSYYNFIKNKIINSSSPYFNFNVTIQNHGGYGGTFDNFKPHVHATDYNDQYLNTYISLIRHSDDAFKDLVEYVSKQKEKTIILMFGDHQPNDFVVRPIYNARGIDATTLTGANRMVRYKVPVIFWANYDIPEEHNLTISANYLGGLLNKLSGVKTTPYQNFLEKLRADIPVISTQGFLDKNLQYHDIDKIDSYSKLINEYKILQYYLMFDKK